MNKLRRVNTMDLQELREMLNQEPENNINECSEDNSKEEFIINNAESFNNEINDEKNSIKTDKSKIKEKLINKNETLNAEKQPFIITGIKSKHKSNKLNNFFSRERLSNEFYSSNKNNFPVYKSIHYKTIVDTEKKLERKFEDLEKLLQRDILMRTVSICDQSMNEAKQLIQNSLATSRIVSSFLRDISKSEPLTTIDQPTSNIIVPTIEEISSDVLVKVFSERDVGKRLENLSDSSYHPEIKNKSTNLFGISATTDSIDSPSIKPKSARTEHYLVSDDPNIQMWMNKKTNQIKLERRLKREEVKIERAISVGALAVQERRKEAAQEAYRQWFLKKKQAKQLNFEGKNDESTDSGSDIGLPQAGRQPKPQRILPIRGSTSFMRPKSSATFTVNSNIKMKIAGQKKPLSNYESSRQSIRTQISNDYPRLSIRRYSSLIRPQTAVPQARKIIEKSPSNQVYIRKEKTMRHKRKKRSLVDNSIKVENDSFERINGDIFEGVSFGFSEIEEKMKSNDNDKLKNTEIERRKIELDENNKGIIESYESTEEIVVPTKGDKELVKDIESDEELNEFSDQEKERITSIENEKEISEHFETDEEIVEVLESEIESIESELRDVDFSDYLKIENFKSLESETFREIEQNSDTYNQDIAENKSEVLSNEIQVLDNDEI